MNTIERKINVRRSGLFPFFFLEKRIDASISPLYSDLFVSFILTIWTAII